MTSRRKNPLRRQRGSEPLPLSDEEAYQKQTHRKSIGALSFDSNEFDIDDNIDNIDNINLDNNIDNNNGLSSNGINNGNRKLNRSYSELSILVQERYNNVSKSSCICKWCCRILHLCNTFIVIILIFVTLYLFTEIQTIKSTIINDEKLITDIKKQLNNQQMKQNNLNQRVEDEHSFTLYQLAGTFTLLTCLITLFHITQHINNWNEPEIQRKILTILWMSPIYSITSWLSLVFIKSSGYLSIIKDFYEAYVIYTFLSFLIAVLGRGNRNTAILVLSNNPEHLSKPTSLFNKLYHPPPNESDQAKAGALLLECQILAMQFVLLRPFTSIIRFIVETLIEHKQLLLTYNEKIQLNNDNWSYFKSPIFIIDMITNISVGFAFHGLLKFYHTVHHDLKWCQPFNKFMCIKGIVFLTFWQGLLISILCSINADEKNIYNTNNNHDIANNNTRRYLSDEFLNIISNEFDNITDKAIDTILNDTSIGEFADNNYGSGNVLNSMNNTIYNTNNTYNNGYGYNNNDTTIPIPQYNNTYNNDNHHDYDNNNDPINNARDQAAKIQSFLICLEMLFFTIAHWCVFPIDEWKPNYRPTKFVKPGIGLKDFASDISYIVNTSTSARAYNKQQKLELQQQQYQEQDQDQQRDISTLDCTTNENSFHDDEDYYVNDNSNNINNSSYISPTLVRNNIQSGNDDQIINNDLYLHEENEEEDGIFIQGKPASIVIDDLSDKKLPELS